MTIVGESLCTFHVPKTNSHDYALRESHDFEFLRARRCQKPTPWNCPDNSQKTKACTFHVGKPICRDNAPANCLDKKFLRQNQRKQALFHGNPKANSLDSKFLRAAQGFSPVRLDRLSQKWVLAQCAQWLVQCLTNCFYQKQPASYAETRFSPMCAQSKKVAQ